KTRKTRKKDKEEGEKSDHNPLGLNLRVVAEIHQQAQAMARGPQVVVNLGSVGVVKRLHCLDLQDDLVEADEVRNVLLLQTAALGIKGKSDLRAEGNAPQVQLDFEGFLVHFLQKAAAEYLVHLEARPDDSIALLLIDDLHIFPPFLFFVFFVSFVVISGGST